jgi:2-keto-3-deoxy-L-rhamnonate aldolase RhmA
MPAETPRPDPARFRQRLAARERLIGSFVKTPGTHATEILGALGFDFVIIDAEHAPLDRAAIDTMLLAARAAGTAGLVRVAEANAAAILSVLDCGAAGVLVPHVASAGLAAEAAAAARYRGGRRGYSGSHRAAGYGAGGLAGYLDRADAETTVIAMIEDKAALDAIDAICAVEGIDALFIGRGDLTVALGAASNTAPAVQQAVEHVAAAARRAGKPVCVMVNAAAEAAPFAALGASAFIVASDQGFLRRAAGAALADFARETAHV